MSSDPYPLLGLGERLQTVAELDRGDLHEGIERYAYRSFDRQWVIADDRLVDFARPDFWRARGTHQVFLTSLTSTTTLGRGPVLTATPYVPDMAHFRGSYGGKDVMPLFRDADANDPNVNPGLLATLSETLHTDIEASDLVAYVYGLGGTSAFSERFSEELSEAAGPIHIPITTDRDLFERAVAFGRDLLWWHTWGERFAPAGQSRLPAGLAREVAAVEGMPEKFDYNSAAQRLIVGTGAFEPVSEEVWNFEVSGLRVLRSWLGYRMKKRKGRKSSPLDDIRPTRWTQSSELLLLLSIVEHTVEVTPKATELLGEIVSGPLISASDLPVPTPESRKIPRQKQSETLTP